jgi:DNA/RNA-binding domain of Phe-tRNA-synthetase-like protein
VGALSRAYEAIGATGLAVQRLVRGVRRRHPLGTTAQLSDAGYLALLRTRLPALGHDIDTLTNALASKPSAEQLVSAGAAIDHIERNLIT